MSVHGPGVMRTASRAWLSECAWPWGYAYNQQSMTGWVCMALGLCVQPAEHDWVSAHGPGVMCTVSRAWPSECAWPWGYMYSQQSMTEWVRNALGLCVQPAENDWVSVHGPGVMCIDSRAWLSECAWPWRYVYRKQSMFAWMKPIHWYFYLSLHAEKRPSYRSRCY